MLEFKKAFTLAEMMVVLLIMSIILAAMAPVMTTRDNSMRDNSSPWKWTDDRADTYFGLGDTQTAMIGQKKKEETDGNYVRFIISAITGHDDEAAHILFKKGEDITGRLFVSGGNTFLSNGSFKGDVNTAIGYNTLLENEDGDANTALGAEAMKQNKGSNNTAIGANAFHLSTGNNNTIVGVDALSGTEDNSPSGNNNTAIGVHALRYASGSNNIAIGYQANDGANISVNDTIAIGQNTVSTGATTTGSYYGSIAIGNSASATGARSLALGINSAATNYNAIAIGHNTLASGYNSLVLGGFLNEYGGDSGGSNQTKATGSYSISIGSGTLVTSNNAIAIGGSDPSIAGAVRTTASGTSSIAIGNEAVATSIGSIAIGRETSATSDGGIAIGDGAETESTTNYTVSDKEYGISIGYNSYSIGNDVAIGKNAGARYSGTSGNGANVAIGTNSLNTNSSATKTVAIGYYAIGSNSYNANYSVAVGADTIIYGGNSVAVGYGAYGSDNGTAIGSNASAGKSSGSYSGVAVGYRAGTNENQPYNNDGVSYGIAIGDYSGATSSSSIAIGSGTYAESDDIAIGHGISCTGSGSSICIGNNTVNEEHIYLGGTSNFNHAGSVLEVHNISDEFSYGGSDNNASGVVINGALIVKGPILAKMKLNGANSYTSGFLEQSQDNDDVYLMGGDNDLNKHPLWSDRRLKYVGKENTSGLDKIRQLKVFNYTFKKDEKKTPHVGVIAQDLQKIFPDAVNKAKDGFLRIRLEDMFYAMINAIKELDAKYKAQEQRINELEKRIQKLEAKMK